MEQEDIVLRTLQRIDELIRLGDARADQATRQYRPTTAMFDRSLRQFMGMTQAEANEILRQILLFGHPFSMFVSRDSLRAYADRLRNDIRSAAIIAFLSLIPQPVPDAPPGRPRIAVGMIMPGFFFFLSRCTLDIYCFFHILLNPHWNDLQKQGFVAVMNAVGNYERGWLFLRNSLHLIDHELARVENGDIDLNQWNSETFQRLAAVCAFCENKFVPRIIQLNPYTGARFRTDFVRTCNYVLDYDNRNRTALYNVMEHVMNSIFFNYARIGRQFEAFFRVVIAQVPFREGFIDRVNDAFRVFVRECEAVGVELQELQRNAGMPIFFAHVLVVNELDEIGDIDVDFVPEFVGHNRFVAMEEQLFPEEEVLDTEDEAVPVKVGYKRSRLFDDDDRESKRFE